MKNFSKAFVCLVLLYAATLRFTVQTLAKNTSDDYSGQVNLYLPVLSDQSITINSETKRQEILADAIWPTYYHSAYSLTLSYPQDWVVETPDVDQLSKQPDDMPEGYTHSVDVEKLRTFGNSITLLATENSPFAGEAINIFVDAFRNLPNGNLQTWAELRVELDQLNNSLRDITTATVVTETAVYAPKGADATISVLVANKYMESETVWIAKDGLVFGVSTFSQEAEVVELMHKITAAFEFGDIKTLAETFAKYTQDEDNLYWAIEHARPQPEPECDIVCQDEKKLKEIPDGVPSKSTINSQVNSSDSISPASLNELNVNVSGEQKALPSDWVTPVFTTTTSGAWVVSCSSAGHHTDAEFAIDINSGLFPTVINLRPIYAAFAGTVTFSGWNTDGYGNLVKLSTILSIADESRTYTHWYGHMAYTPDVSQGQAIYRGQLLGYVGTTGNSTGPHLHFHV